MSVKRSNALEKSDLSDNEIGLSGEKLHFENPELIVDVIELVDYRPHGRVFLYKKSAAA